MTLTTTDHQIIIEMMNKKLKSLGVINAVTATPSDTTTTQPSIQNLFDNGAIEWSKDAYLNNPLLAGDIGYEAYHFFRQTQATTLLAETAANALKSTTHSLFAANEGANADIPQWNRVDGWAEFGAIGTAYDIAAPLPTNFVREGVSFLIQFVHKLRTATAWPAGIEVAAMFYDNTAGQEKIIEGGPFTISASVPNPGATALEYKVIGRTDYGEEIESNVLAVPNAPATLSITHYVELSWVGAAGYINFDVYKKDAGIYYLVGEVDNGGTSFRDIGNTLSTVAGYPSISTTQARAYVETQGLAPTSEWARTTVVIRAPSTYNTSLTTGKQWLRLRITGATTDARQLLIDRIGVSTGDGGWARSANDLRAASAPSTTAATSDQGGVGIEHPLCPAVDVEIDGMLGEDEVKIRAGDLQKGDKVIRRGKVARVTRARTVWCENRVNVITTNGKSLPCSPFHPVLQGEDDTKGRAASRMQKGQSVDTKDGASEIESVDEIGGGFVVDFGLTAPHTYWANDIGSHNVKLDTN